ncbi:MAG: hypothetical protein RL410_996 [Actinomycetota bacterium]
MFSVRARVLVLLLLISTVAPARAAVVVPVASDLAINPVTWSAAATPLSVAASMSSAGNWKIEVISRCSGISLRTATGTIDHAGRATTTFNQADEPVLTNGPYEVRFTPLSTSQEAGKAISKSLTIKPATQSKTRKDVVCPNAQRLVQVGTADSIITAQVYSARLTNPSATTAIISGYDATHIATTAVTAVYARMKEFPLYFTKSTALSTSVSNELAKRHITNVILVGDIKNMSAKVEADLKKKNITFTRVQSKTLTGLALKFFTKSLVPAGTPAVYVNYSGDTRYLLEAASFASATNRPLLPMGDTTSDDVIKAAKTLKLAGGVAIGSKVHISDRAIAMIPEVVRVFSADAVQQSLVLSRSIANPVAGAILYPSSVKVDVLTLAALTTPRMPIAYGVNGLSLSQRRFINARGDVANLLSTTSDANMSDAAIASVAVLMSQRGETTIPILQQPDFGPLVAPATFGFSGSGYGHGIGFSQWGAYAMAKAGMTTEEIVTHYFPQTTLGDTTDSFDMHVGLQSRISKLTLRLASIDVGDAQWTLVASSGEKVTLPEGATVSFKYTASTDKVTATFKNAPGATLPAAEVINVYWSGARNASKYSLGDLASKVQVIGPGETSTTGRWYRFGYLRVAGVTSSTASDGTTKAAGLTVSNSVRLHDEYLYGLGEVPSSWPANALQAQVIAARGYAYNKAYSSGTLRKRSVECDCTVQDGANDQVFVGYSKLAEAAGPRWKSAVDATLTSATTGQVVKFGDVVAQTFFSSATGGATQNNQDVWGSTPRAYLQSVDDPWSIADTVDQKIAAWQPRIRPQAFMANIFGLAQVNYLDLSNRYASGALRSVTAYGVSPQGSTVSVTMSASNFRTSMGKDIDPTDGVDPYDALPSDWAWRLGITFKGADLAEQTMNLVSQRSLGYAQTAASKSTKAVLVAASENANDVNLFLASAFAGAEGAALYVVRTSGDATRIKTELQSRAITGVTTVGVIDSAVTNALIGASIPVRNITGASASDLSQKLADETNSTSASGVVLVSEQEPAAWPLAVSVAARAAKPLLLVDDGALSPETAQWLTAFSPDSITIVGTSASIPDAVVAGFDNASRLNTSDLPLASLAALNFGTGTVRAIAVASADSDINKSVVAASLGLPMFYSDVEIKDEVISWLRRKSLVASIVNVATDESFVQALRYA